MLENGGNVQAIKYTEYFTIQLDINGIELIVVSVAI